jgi:O-glycosyl hydrolase
MDKFHKLLELVDKNANTIPEGDYIQMCNIIKEIHEKVRPPRFLLDQNEPIPMPIYEPTQMTPQEQAEFMEELHREWSEPMEDIRLMREQENEEFMEALRQVSEMIT